MDQVVVWSQGVFDRRQRVEVIFPQGTRRVIENLPFKDGAFKIAIENEAPLIPVSINIPINMWNSMYPLNLLWGEKNDENEVSLSSNR